MQHEDPERRDGASAVRAVWRGKVVAESHRAREVGGYVYFPRAEVRAGMLHAVAKSASDRACPHGVQFYDVGQGATRSPRAAWSYEAPGAAMREIDHWIGFWEDVEIVPAPGALE